MARFGRVCFALALGVLVVACGGSNEEQELSGIALDIEYRAATEFDESVREIAGGCVSIVSPTHYHGTWDNLARRLMTADGPETWRASTGVSSAGRYKIRIEDPNTCGQGGGEGADGSVFRPFIYVNGTRLTERTLTESGEGPRTSWWFRVLPDGTVTAD